MTPYFRFKLESPQYVWVSNNTFLLYTSHAKTCSATEAQAKKSYKKLSTDIFNSRPKDLWVPKDLIYHWTVHKAISTHLFETHVFSTIKDLNFDQITDSADEIFKEAFKKSTYINIS